MAQVTISEAHYQELFELAQARGVSPDDLVDLLIEEQLIAFDQRAFLGGEDIEARIAKSLGRLVPYYYCIACCFHMVRYFLMCYSVTTWYIPHDLSRMIRGDEERDRPESGKDGVSRQTMPTCAERYRRAGERNRPGA